MKQEKLNNALCWAADANDFNKIVYLLTSPELTEHADIHANQDEVFRTACNRGNLPLVQFLLTSTTLKERVDIHCCDDYGIVEAVSSGNIELVQYLLTSPELSEHIDVNALEGLALCAACRYGHLDIVKFLLFAPEIDNLSLSKHAFEEALENQHYHIIDYFLQTYDLQAQIESKINMVDVYIQCIENEDLNSINYLLSINGKYRVSFENTSYNLDYVLGESNDELIAPMMKNLYFYDPLEYIERLAHLEKSHKKTFNVIKKWEKNLPVTSPSEISLTI